MKFDVVVGNPPYDRSLHLKVLKKTMEHVDFENGGEIVWLAPLRWMQDPLAKYKSRSAFHKYEDTILKKIESIDVHSAKDMTSLFGGESCVVFKIDLGVIKLGKDGGYDYMKFSNPVIDKVMSSPAHGIQTTTLKMSRTGNFALLIDIVGDHDGVITIDTAPPYVKNPSTYGKYYVDFKSEKNGCSVKENKSMNKRSVHGNPDNWTIVEFETEAELKNFYNFTSTKFFRWVFAMSVVDVNVNHSCMPWMGNSVNPRTHATGYAGEWTDADLYQFFGLTPEEIKLIEETVK